jgi:hypothetical protein
MKKVIMAMVFALYCTGLLCAQSAGPEVPAEQRGYFVETPKYMAKNIKKGALVDILVTFEAVTKGDKAPQKMTATILQTIEVLDSGIEGEKGFVLLSTTPMEAQYLNLSEQEGKIAIILRNAKDKKVTAQKIATMKTLFS